MNTVNRYVEKRGNKWVPRKDLRNVLPSWLAVRLSDSTGALAVTTTPQGISFEQQNFNDIYKSYRVCKHLIFADSTDGTASSNVKCKLTEKQYMRDLMNVPTHIRNVFGTAQLPGLLYEPLIVQANGIIRGEFTKISGGSVNVRAYLGGKEYYVTDSQRLARLLERKRIVSPFFLCPEPNTSGDTVSLTALGTSQFQTKVGMGNFQAISLVAISTGAFNLEITESQTKRTLMNGLITSTNGIGNGIYPRKFDMPMMLPQGAIIKWKFTDTSNATNTVFVCMQGKYYFCPMKHIPEAEYDTAISYDDLEKFA